MQRLIETEEENERAIAELERLDSLPRMTPEQDSGAELLTLLIEQYEQKYDLGHADPLEALRSLMEDRGLRERDLIPVFGSSTVASDVLNGKREISKQRARRLAEFFHAPMSLFISGSQILRGLWIAALLCFGVADARSTTIIAVRTPVDISIAADSLGTMRGADGRITTKRVCKIYSQDNLFLGVAGLDNDDGANFKVSDIVFDAIRSERRLADKMSAASKALQSRLLSEARTFRSSRPKDFDALTNPDSGGTSIMLIGIEDGVPAGIGQQFTVSVDSNKSIQVMPTMRTGCPGDCPSGVMLFHMGTYAAIEGYLAVDPQRRRIVDSADYAAKLVQLEIDAHASGVGGPINVLRLTANGPHWVHRSDADKGSYATTQARSQTLRRIAHLQNCRDQSPNAQLPSTLHQCGARYDGGDGKSRDRSSPKNGLCQAERDYSGAACSRSAASR
jgi:HTH-type transcriptional regulator/antitoxin HigA